MSTFLFKHAVDLSLLTNGFHIQTEFHQLVYSLPGGILRHGESRDIKVIIEGEEFITKLYNINFDKSKYPDHPDLLQVRYSPNSPIAKKLQSIFDDDYRYLLTQREMVGPRKQIRLPEGNHDDIVFSGTSIKDVFVLDCIRSNEYKQASEEVANMNELDFETSFISREDNTACINEIEGIRKIRHLDRTIGDSLKRLYDYRCQMTGERVGASHEALVVEAHHIIPFTQSMNNDTSNIIIISPSYHRIIHKTNPIWDSKKLSFCYPNGLIEKVKIDKHLNITHR